MKHFPGFLYLPQSSCSLLLVNVDEVSHHTALDHISLSLHADLEGQTEVMSIQLNLRRESMQKQAKSGSVLIRLPLECKGKKLRREFWQAQCPEVFPLSSFPGILQPLLNLFTFIMVAVYRSALGYCLDPC